ncbi:MAG: DUF3987 domain-containing protein [Saprospiraceae bacterium]|nr:DUF3987 domain-containing protein [Saprospiraceae bacterium]MCF8252337.1 DUF3987 domain-containing protein [Saprospiraceae bacterium]MCF8282308.1 DUF3987 domain-containing protein [Bacteroidales bacterium]MCF8313770.1 DUF3987 domain-containing protein [Saprospiraceae bacterium]MCF8442476.1 DUF3987 domain-containing protein [Saprospiraceae bacterium]
MTNGARPCPRNPKNRPSKSCSFPPTPPPPWSSSTSGTAAARGSNEFFEIDQPRLSVAISGTPKQILKLIPSVEDGLFSRFLFYCYAVQPAWRDVSPATGGINLTEHFASLSERTLEVTRFTSENPVQFYLTTDQWQRLNEHFTRLLQETNAFFGTESPGRGMYRLATREDFIPVFSNLSKRIAALLAKELPLVNVCIWETRWPNAWMELQPAYNWTLVEAEKDALDAIFNHLTGLSKKVYLQPNRSIMDLYVLSLNEAVIVKPLVSEAPLMREGKITTAAPGKMLVDIVAEPDILMAQQGELQHIFENVFSQILIHQNRRLRYARRRKREEQVRMKIPEQHRLKT